MQPRLMMMGIYASLALCTQGCAGRQVQTQPDEPHGYLRIHIAHPDTPEHLFRDEIQIDGEPMALGSGRGGDLALRLAPGTHSLVFTSTLVEYALELGERSPTTRRSLELTPHEDKVCQKALQIEITTGATQEVTYKTGLPPQCDVP